MLEVTEYVAKALLSVCRPGEIFPMLIQPKEILPDWVHDDEIKALLDRGLIAPRGSSVS
jgi:hypothetical protein